MKLRREILSFLNVAVVIILLLNKVNLSLTDSSISSSSLINGELKELNKMKVMEMTKEEKKKFESIKKPTLPSQMPADVKFMLKELTKTYRMAEKQVYPRFAETSEMNKKIMSLFPKDERKYYPVGRSP